MRDLRRKETEWISFSFLYTVYVYIKLCVVDYEEDRAKPPRKVQKINSRVSLLFVCVKPIDANNTAREKGI